MENTKHSELVKKWKLVLDKCIFNKTYYNRCARLLDAQYVESKKEDDNIPKEIKNCTVAAVTKYLASLVAENRLEYVVSSKKTAAIYREVKNGNIDFMFLSVSKKLHTADEFLGFLIEYSNNIIDSVYSQIKSDKLTLPDSVSSL